MSAETTRHTTMISILTQRYIQTSLNFRTTRSDSMIYAQESIRSRRTKRGSYHLTTHTMSSSRKQKLLV